MELTRAHKLAPRRAAPRRAGVTTEEQLLSPDNSIHPDYYADSLAALLEAKGELAAAGAAK